MDGFNALEDYVFTGATVHALSTSGQRAVRESDDIDELIPLRARLRSVSAGRGLWLLWAWLLLLSGAWITAEGVIALFVLLAWLFVLVSIVSYVSRTRRRADAASEWLSEIDFRLAQLAARGESRDPSQP